MYSTPHSPPTTRDAAHLLITRATQRGTIRGAHLLTPDDYNKIVEWLRSHMPTFGGSTVDTSTIDPFLSGGGDLSQLQREIYSLVTGHSPVMERIGMEHREVDSNRAGREVREIVADYYVEAYATTNTLFTKAMELDILRKEDGLISTTRIDPALERLALLPTREEMREMLGADRNATARANVAKSTYLVHRGEVEAILGALYSPTDYAVMYISYAATNPRTYEYGKHLSQALAIGHNGYNLEMFEAWLRPAIEDAIAGGSIMGATTNLDAYWQFLRETPNFTDATTGIVRTTEEKLLSDLTSSLYNYYIGTMRVRGINLDRLVVGHPHYREFMGRLRGALVTDRVAEVLRTGLYDHIQAYAVTPYLIRDEDYHRRLVNVMLSISREL